MEPIDEEKSAFLPFRPVYQFLQMRRSRSPLCLPFSFCLSAYFIRNFTLYTNDKRKYKRNKAYGECFLTNNRIDKRKNSQNISTSNVHTFGRATSPNPLFYIQFILCNDVYAFVHLFIVQASPPSRLSFGELCFAFTKALPEIGSQFFKQSS